MINILEYAKQFKNCTRVNYIAYVCKPPIGSCVLNMITNYKAVCLLGNKQFLTNREVKQIQQSNPKLYNLIRGNLVKHNDFVVNTNGILSIVSYDELVSNYRFTDDSPLTQSRLLPKSYICEMQDNVITPVDITLISAYKKGIKNPEANLVIPWFKVQWYNHFEEEYLYIDRNKMPEFRVYLPMQDVEYFVIVANSDEKTAKIITADEFVYCYDQRGKSYGRGKKEPMRVPRPLFSLSHSTNGINTFSKIIKNVVDTLYSNSFAIQEGVVNDITTEIISDKCITISFRLGYTDMYFLAYKKNDRYYIATGNKDVFTCDYNSDINRYINYLERNNSILFKTSVYKAYIELFIAFLTLENSSVISNYYNPKLTANEIVNLKKYSGTDYGKINSYLRGMVTDDDFMSYIQSVFIFEVIERSKVLRNQFHFRGLLLDSEESKKLKAGYIIKNPNFVSTSVSFSVTCNFVTSALEDEEGIILVFKNTAMKHGIYIDNYSVHKGSEFEVIFNIGSNFKLVKKLGYYHELDCKPCAVWLCELIEDKNVNVRKYAYKKDAVEKLVYLIQNSNLMKNFYISGVDDNTDFAGVTLTRYNTEDLTIYIKLKDSVFNIEFVGYIDESYSFNIKEKGYNHLFQYISSVIQNRGTNKEFMNTALSSFSERFMLDLMNIFSNNNFVITQQNFNIGVFDDPLTGSSDFIVPFSNKGERDLIELRKSEFTILNADARPLKIEINIHVNDKKYINIEVIAYDDDKKPVTKKFSCDIANRFDLYETIYYAIVKKFNLDPRRRLKHIFSIVSGFYENYIEFIDRGDKYTCCFDNKSFDIKQVGASIIISHKGSSITINYFDDIYEAASKIQAMI